MYIKVCKNLYNYELKYINIDSLPKYYTSVNKNNDVISSSVLSRSVSRSVAVIMDYALNNEFDYFVTFTYDFKKYDSNKIEVVKKTIANFRRKLNRLGGSYILVPELHPNSKDGIPKFHLHGLIRCDKLNIINSGYTTKYGFPIYYIKNWSYGYTTACKITNVEYVTKYISKYMSKDLIKTKYAKRYYCSKGLKHSDLLFTGFSWFNNFIEDSEFLYCRDNLKSIFRVPLDLDVNIYKNN